MSSFEQPKDEYAARLEHELRHGFGDLSPASAEAIRHMSEHPERYQDVKFPAAGPGLTEDMLRQSLGALATDQPS